MASIRGRIIKEVRERKKEGKSSSYGIVRHTLLLCYDDELINSPLFLCCSPPLDFANIIASVARLAIFGLAAFVRLVSIYLTWG